MRSAVLMGILILPRSLFGSARRMSFPSCTSSVRQMPRSLLSWAFSDFPCSWAAFIFFSLAMPNCRFQPSGIWKENPASP